MGLAWKEMKHSRKKFVLIEAILVLMIFMVIFLSGLANGLKRAVSAAIENTDAVSFVLSEGADDLITVSSLDTGLLEQIKSLTGGDGTPLNIQRMNMKQEGSETKLDITYFAIDPEGYLNPKTNKGEMLSADYEVVLDDSYMDEGIELGDVIEDATTGISLTVVGFTKDALYGHTPAGYITTATYEAIRTAINPAYQLSYHTIALQNKGFDAEGMTGITVSDKNAVIQKIPGYAAEQTTINMILWVLVVISGAVLGVFFYVITIQKQRQYGVLKAIGMKMSEIAGMITGQIFILAIIGVAAGNALAFTMAAFLPSSMPFYLQTGNAVLISVAFIAISVLCSLVSTRSIAKVDPVITIGGQE